MSWPIAATDPKVGSFLPWLEKTLNMTQGAILELGAGPFSTPFLAEYCKAHHRGWWTYEYDLEFAVVAQRFNKNVVESPQHVPDGPWGVVLVDCEGWARLDFLQRLRGSTDVFVIHDSQDHWIPEEVLASFRYRFDSDEEPRTSVVSDLVPVDELA